MSNTVSRRSFGVLLLRYRRTLPKVVDEKRTATFGDLSKSQEDLHVRSNTIFSWPMT